MTALAPAPATERSAAPTAAITQPDPPPRHAELAIDVAFVLVLGALALSGLGPTFTGQGFLLVGVLGVGLGALASALADFRRWPGAAGVIIAMVLFFALGPVLCLRAESDPWPTPDAVRLLSRTAVLGWKDLLTTLPPIDGAGPLLVLPWLLGLTMGSVAVALARLSKGPSWLRSTAPLVVPILVLGLVILLGLHHPQSILLQGSLFATALLAWLALRGLRSAVAVTGSTGRAGRVALGAALLTVTAAVAVPIGLLGDGADGERVVLRDQVEPPFDIGRYPSPLASFRRYVEFPHDAPAENLYERELFTVSGVPAGTRVRFATLDRYDGTVWGASDHAIPGADNDVYQRVSTVIDNPVSGRSVSALITLGEGYSGVWLPMVGALQAIDFRTGSLQARADSFRFNLATSTAVVPLGVAPGDSYQVRAVLPDDEVTADSDSGAPVGEAAEAAAFLEAQATEWSGEAKTPMKRVFAIADHLRAEGKYTDGVATAERIYHAGHFQGRLSEFVNAPIIAGDDEQYAATMALLANRVGVPARVVFGAVVPEGGVVHGSDVAAWVELQVADGSWRTLPTDAFMGREHPAKLPPQSQQSVGGTNVPPPAPIPPPSTEGDQADARLKAEKVVDDTARASRAVPSWVRYVGLAVGGPLAVISLLLGSIVLAKAWRRRRRRTAGPASARVGGGWRELVDHARDLGRPVSADPVRTRREQSAEIATGAAVALAQRADAHVFGPEAPHPEAAESFWEAVSAERKAMSAAVGRWRRLIAAVSLRTFRRG